MLNNLISKVERIGSLGSSGPWWWRWVGGAISLTVLIVLFLALR